MANDPQPGMALKSENFHGRLVDDVTASDDGIAAQSHVVGKADSDSVAGLGEYEAHLGRHIVFTLAMPAANRWSRSME